MATPILPVPPPEGNMDRPEIENGLIDFNYRRQRERLENVTTSIDLLEIPQHPMAEARWHEGLDHNALLRHFEVDSRCDPPAPCHNDAHRYAW
jgi:hypothetical protein